jgi:COMPASS component SWD1
MNVALLNPYTSDHPEVVESELDNQGVSTTVVAFDRHGNYLACGANDGRVIVWDCVTRSAARELCGHVQPITALSWSRDSQRLLSASVDWSVRVWFLADVGNNLAAARGVTMRCQAQIGHAYLHPRENLFLVCPLLLPAQLVEWDSANSNQLSMRALPLPDAAALGGRAELALGASVAIFTTRGDQIVTGNRKGVVLVLDTKSLQVIRTVTVSSHSAIKSIALSHTGKRILLNCADKRIRMYALDRDWALEREFFDAINRFQWRCCCFSPHDDYIVGGSAHKSSHKLYLWNSSGNLIKILEHEKSGVLSTAWHPHRVLLASASAAGPVLLWSAVQQERWSAYAPKFTELEENVEYVEREDEFDIQDEADLERERQAKRRLMQGDENELVDIVAPDPLLRIDDVDDDDKPFFLPTVPEPDAPDLRTDSANRPIAVALTTVALNHAIDAARRAVPPVTKRAKTTKSDATVENMGATTTTTTTTTGRNRQHNQR